MPAPKSALCFAYCPSLCQRSTAPPSVVPGDYVSLLVPSSMSQHPRGMILICWNPETEKCVLKACLWSFIQCLFHQFYLLFVSTIFLSLLVFFPTLVSWLDFYPPCIQLASVRQKELEFIHPSMYVRGKRMIRVPPVKCENVKVKGR